MAPRLPNMYSKFDPGCRRCPRLAAFLDAVREDEPGFWETYGYHMYGDPWLEQRYAGD